MIKIPTIHIQGDAGYQDVLESAGALAMVYNLWVDISISWKSCFNWILIHFSFCVFYLQLLKLKPEEVLIESTGIIGQRIKKVCMIDSTVNKL